MTWWIPSDDGFVRADRNPLPSTYEPLPVVEWNCRCVATPFEDAALKTFSGNAHQRRVKRRAWLREQS